MWEKMELFLNFFGKNEEKLQKIEKNW